MYSLCLSLIYMFTRTRVARWDPLIQQIKGLSSCPYYRCCWRAVEDAGAQGRVGVGRAGGSVGGAGQAGRAGAADYSGNCQLQCLQSGSNRFRVGEEKVTVDFCQASLCLCVSRLSGMTFVRTMVEMSHHLILSLIIHPPSQAPWLWPCCLPFNGAGDYQHWHLKIQIIHRHQAGAKSITHRGSVKHIQQPSCLLQTIQSLYMQ